MKDTYHYEINLLGLVIIDDKKCYILDRITDKEKRKKKSFYKIKWIGYNT